MAAARGAQTEKVKRAPSKNKVILTVFFDHKGIILQNYRPYGSTITADNYIELLQKLRKAIRQKRPALWATQNWVLHHDNAPAHCSLKVSEFLKKHKTSVLPQPPYSPDLAPCDFFLFDRLKKPLRGKHFATEAEIETNGRAVLNTIQKDEFSRCFQDWKQRWQRCVGVHGDYFEGDKVELDE